MTSIIMTCHILIDGIWLGQSIIEANHSSCSCVVCQDRAQAGVPHMWLINLKWATTMGTVM